jgi:hypothetical protein
VKAEAYNQATCSWRRPRVCEGDALPLTFEEEPCTRSDLEAIGKLASTSFSWRQPNAVIFHGLKLCDRYNEWTSVSHRYWTTIYWTHLIKTNHKIQIFGTGTSKIPCMSGLGKFPKPTVRIRKAFFLDNFPPSHARAATLQPLHSAQSWRAAHLRRRRPLPRKVRRHGKSCGSRLPQG